MTCGGRGVWGLVAGAARLELVRQRTGASPIEPAVVRLLAVWGRFLHEIFDHLNGRGNPPQTQLERG